MKIWMSIAWAAAAAGLAQAQGNNSNSAMMGMFLVFGLMFLIPIGYFIAAARTDKRAATAKAWPSATATVTKSAFTKQKQKTSVWFTPDLAYSFTAGGRSFEGKRLRFGMDTTQTEADMVALLAPYPAGGTVAVHYNPANPKDSVINPVANSSSYRKIAWIFTVALAVILVVVVAVVFFK